MTEQRIKLLGLSVSQSVN